MHFFSRNINSIENCVEKYIEKATGGNDLPDDTFHFGGIDDNDDDDDTTPLLQKPDLTPKFKSTPAPKGEQFEMKTWQKEKSGLPDTSYAEKNNR